MRLKIKKNETTITHWQWFQSNSIISTNKSVSGFFFKQSAFCISRHTFKRIRCWSSRQRSVFLGTHLLSIKETLINPKYSSAVLAGPSWHLLSCLLHQKLWFTDRLQSIKAISLLKGISQKKGTKVSTALNIPGTEWRQSSKTDTAKNWMSPKNWWKDKVKTSSGAYQRI